MASDTVARRLGTTRRSGPLLVPRVVGPAGSTWPTCRWQGALGVGFAGVEVFHSTRRKISELNWSGWRRQSERRSESQRRDVLHAGRYFLCHRPDKLCRLKLRKMAWTNRSGGEILSFSRQLVCGLYHPVVLRARLVQLHEQLHNFNSQTANSLTNSLVSFSDNSLSQS
jgi:hypothetical protein